MEEDGEKERNVSGTGVGRAVGWNKRALVDYTRCRAGKGNLLSWKKILNPGLEDVMCRRCGKSGAHVALVYIEGEKLGGRFRSWEQADDPKRVLRKV